VKTRDLLDGLRLGDAHLGGLRCLRLFRVEDSTFASLVEDVDRFCVEHRPSRIADASHVTNWAHERGEIFHYSLLTASGRADDFARDHDLSSAGKWFFDQAAYPMLGQLIAAWPDLVNFRVNVLSPGSALAPHEEHVPFRTVTGSVGARVRFHLPVHTNQDAVLNLDGDLFRLEPGVVCLVNHGCVHAARNRGTAPRVHLVWDALLTGRLAEFLLGQTVHRPSFLQCVEVPDADPVGSEELDAHRRLTPSVSPDEVSSLAVCEPQ
jgi:Aspartyl/Asparaginyl beta-hydroxylase.